MITRKIGYTFSLIFLITFFSSCHSEIAKPALESTEEIEIRIYEVFGMDCPGCQGAVQKLVNKIPGVLDSEANWKKKQIVVRIWGGEEVSDETIFDAIRRANFTPGKRTK
jgi:copper chaperone CopZ